MKKIFYAIIAAATIFAGCTTTVDVNEVQRPRNYADFVGEIATDTRTNHIDEGDGTGYAAWVEGEYISLFYQSNPNLQYKVTELSNGSRNARFSYNDYEVVNPTYVDFEKYYAIYPFSESNTMDEEGVIKSIIPTEQSYNAESNFSYVPMVASSDNNSLSFTIPTSITRIKVTKNHSVRFILKQIILSSKSQNIAGEIAINLNGSAPAVEVLGDQKQITLDFGDEGYTLAKGTQEFYISHAAVTFPADDLVISCIIQKGDDVRIIEKQRPSELACEAGEINTANFDITLEDFEGSTAYPATGGELVGNLTLTTDMNISEPLTVPAGEEATVNLNGKSITAGTFAESGGEISEGTTDSYAFWVKDGATLDINGEGTVSTSACKYSIAVWAQGGTVNIYGGTYENAGEGSDLIYASAGGSVNIYGGEFKACEKQTGTEGNGNKYSALNIKDGDKATTTITVYGGKFYGFDPANNLSENPAQSFVAEGYISVETSENVWEVMPADEVIEVSTAAALEDVLLQGGKAILAADITLDDTIYITEGNATIDLNGKTITAGTFAYDDGKVAEGEGDSYVFWVKGGSLTINGDGNVKAQAATYSMAVWADGGTVNINGGNFYNEGNGSDLIYAKNNGKVNIYGGYFEACISNHTEDGTLENYSALNLYGNGADGSDIIVYGGKFYGFDPANNLSENPAQSFVADGYISVETSENVWEVMIADEAYAMPNAVITLTAGTYTLPTEFAEGITLNCQEGVVFEGQSSLDINGAKIVGAKFENTEEKGKVATGVINGEFVDCVFEGDYALRNMKMGEKVSFDGCQFIGSVYGVHFDGATTTNTELVFNDCDFTAWNSFGTAITKVTMTNCRYHHSGKYGRLRFYQNAVVTNSVFDETYDAIDFGAEGNGHGGLNSVFNGCTWTNKNIVDLFIFTGLDEVIIDGSTYPVVADTADAVVEALANGDVVANATISVASELDGNNNTIFVDNELTNNSIITASGDATIKNLNIEGGNIRTTNNNSSRALYFTGAYNITIDNVNVNEVGYSLNYNSSNANATLTVTNSKLVGWASWGNIGWAKFTNVHFGIGNYFTDPLFNGGMRPYASTTLDNCTFDKNFYISTSELSESVTITMKNCKVNDVVLTKDNWQSYLKVEGENTAYVLFE